MNESAIIAARCRKPFKAGLNHATNSAQLSERKGGGEFVCVCVWEKANFPYAFLRVFIWLLFVADIVFCVQKWSNFLFRSVSFKKPSLFFIFLLVYCGNPTIYWILIPRMLLNTAGYSFSLFHDMINGRWNGFSAKRGLTQHPKLKNEISFFITIRFVENFVVSNFCVFFNFFFIEIYFFSGFFSLSFSNWFQCFTHFSLPLCLFWSIELVWRKRFYFR